MLFSRRQRLGLRLLFTLNTAYRPPEIQGEPGNLTALMMPEGLTHHNVTIVKN